MRTLVSTFLGIPYFFLFMLLNKVMNVNIFLNIVIYAFMFAVTLIINKTLLKDNRREFNILTNFNLSTQTPFIATIIGLAYSVINTNKTNFSVSGNSEVLDFTTLIFTNLVIAVVLNVVVSIVFFIISRVRR
jgi:hypothetical protein